MSLTRGYSKATCVDLDLKFAEYKLCACVCVCEGNNCKIILIVVAFLPPKHQGILKRNEKSRSRYFERMLF